MGAALGREATCSRQREPRGSRAMLTRHAHCQRLSRAGERQTHTFSDPVTQVLEGRHSVKIICPRDLDNGRNAGEPDVICGLARWSLIRQD